MSWKTRPVPAVLVAATVVMCSALAGPPETVLVDFGSSMRYLDNAGPPGILLEWTELVFDDGAWSNGAYGVGYDNGGAADDLILTETDPGRASIFTRAEFQLDLGWVASRVLLGVDYDDGYVAWINGVEVSRRSMPAGAPAWNTSASGHESSNGTLPVYEWVDITSIAAPLLQTGDNVLAIGVWNTGVGSSDMVLVPQLVLNRPTLLDRGPYLQQGSDSEIVVRFDTNTPETGRVRYGSSPGSLTATANGAGVGLQHAVKLTGLSANATYYYAVGTAAGDLAGDDIDHYFSTAPLAGTADPTRVWVLGDSGTANANVEAVRDAYYTYTGATHTDLWLMLGDNAYPQGTQQDYQAAVFDMFPDMLRKSVLWPARGNHDTANGANETGPYFDIFTLPKNAETGGVASGSESYYSFDHANVHFVVLDSQESDRSSGGAMMTWLAADLSATAQDWIIAFWHHPPFSKGGHDSDNLNGLEFQLVDMRENAVPLLEDHGVDLVLTGHSHTYERSFLIDGHYGDSTTFLESMKLDGGDGRLDGDGAYFKPLIGPEPHQGAVYAVAGSSGQLSSGALDHPAMYVGLYKLGSMVLDIDGNRLDALFLDDQQVVLDSFTIFKSAPAPPVPAFSGAPLSGQAPLSVDFTDLSLNAPDSWEWDFDNDGASESPLQNPGHVYATTGLYTVRLVVGNVLGSDTAIVEEYVCVGDGVPGPVSDMTLDADGETWLWSPGAGATRYDVARGDLLALRASAGDFAAAQSACLSAPDNQLTDATAPGAAAALWYVVRGASCLGSSGSYDSGGAGQPLSRDPGLSVCP
ncbi:MAG: PKD domain-containing protein [bacterium]|nr:PKD domain-containing protein [bacterium]